MNTSKALKEAQIKKVDVMIATLTDIKHKLIKQLAEINDQPSKGDWYILKNENKYYQYLSTTKGEVALVRCEDITRISEQAFKDNYLKAAADDVVRHINYLNSKKRSYVKVDLETSGFSDSINAIASDVDKNIAYIHDLLEEKMTPKLDGSYYWMHLNELAKKLRLEPDGYKLNIHDFKERGIGKSHTDISKLLFGQAGTGMSYIDVIEAAKAKKAFDPSKCEFYMVNIGNGNGSKVRHDNYEKAEKEAIRLCDTFKTEAFILGVVASVKPVEERKVTVVIKPTVVKR